MFCEACGARLPVSGVAEIEMPEARGEQATGQVDHPSRDKSQKKKQAKSEQQKSRQKAAVRKFEPWQIVSGIAILALIGYFVYSEASREEPPVRTGVAMPGGFPEMAIGSTPEIDQLQKTVDAEPNNAAAILQLANKLHDQSTTSPQLLFRSVEAYKKYLALKPDDPDARVDLGICYFYLTRIDTSNAGQLFSMALSEMQTVAKAHPNHQGAAFNIGIVSLNAGNTEESGKWLKKAVEINPNSDMGARAKKLLEQHSMMQ
jgi:hypothetical protein